MNVLIECPNTKTVLEPLLTLVQGLRARSLKPVFLSLSQLIKTHWRQAGYEAYCVDDFVPVTHYHKKQKELKDIDTTLAFLLEPSHLYQQNYPDQPSSAPSDQQVKDTLKGIGWLLDELEPCLVLSWNGYGSWQQRILPFLAEKRKVSLWYLERGFFPSSIVADQKGANARSGVATWMPVKNDTESKNIPLITSFLEQYHCQAKSVLASKQPPLTPGELRKALQISDTSRILLFPIQIEWDSNILFASPLFKTMRHALTTFLEQIKRSGSTDVLVVKDHPDLQHNPDGIKQAQGVEQIQDSQLRFVKDVHTHSLIRAADLVLTINSNIGFEALTYQKSVVTFGDSIYSGKNLTSDFRNLEQCQRLDQLLRKPLPFSSKQFLILCQFIEHLVTRCLIFSKDNEVIKATNDQIIDSIVSSINLPTSRIASKNHYQNSLSLFSESVCQRIQRAKHLVIIIKTIRHLSDFMEEINTLNPSAERLFLTRYPSNILNKHNPSIEIKTCPDTYLKDFCQSVMKNMLKKSLFLILSDAQYTLSSKEWLAKVILAIQNKKMFLCRYLYTKHTHKL